MPLETKYVLLSTIFCKGITSLLTYPHEVLRARQQDHRFGEGGKAPTNI